MCDGKIEKGIGCIKYSGSDEHTSDAQHEDFMRTGGLGFSTDQDSYDATMSMHLQESHDLSFDEARETIRS